jgi:hypothetical protein
MWFAMSAAHKRHFTHVADDEAKLALFVVQVHARQWPLKSTQVHTSLHKSTPFRHRDGTLLCLVDISVSCGHKAGDEEQQT